jgi:hypothetical protein
MGEKISQDRGIHARYTLMWVKERFGEDGVDRVAKTLTPRTRKMFLKPVPHEWYDAMMMGELFEAIGAEFTPDLPDALLELGRFIARRSIKGFLQYFVRVISVKTTIARSNAIWRRYHDSGSVETTMLEDGPDPKKGLFIVRGYKTVPAWCTVHQGYIEGFLPYTNACNISVEKQNCVHKGDEYCSWMISWNE